MSNADDPLAEVAEALGRACGHTARAITGLDSTLEARTEIAGARAELKLAARLIDARLAGGDH